MPTQTNRDVGCPNCGAAVSTQMWPGISARRNPELRDRLLSEDLFDWQCPECGYRAQLVYPCLYHDKENGFMVYLVPNGSSGEFRPVDVSEAFPQLAEVKKRVVATPAEMKEKILIFEAGLDDFAVELVKYALAGVLDRKYGKKTVRGYFYSASEEEISFTFFPEGEKEPVVRVTRMEAYRKSLEIARGTPEPDGCSFLPVDSLTAREMLENYRGKDGAQEQP